MLVLGLGATACGDEAGDAGGGPAAGLEVERVELDEPLAGEVVAVGDVLLAGAPGDEGLVASVQRSDDGGRTWQPVDLPDAPDDIRVDRERPSVVGGVAVVTARDAVDQGGIGAPGGAAYAWTSADGVSWHGTRLADSGPTFAPVGVVAVGDVLLAGFTAGAPDYLAAGSLTVHRSTDGGASWTPTEVPDLGLGPGETAALSGAWTLPDGRIAAALTTAGGTTGTIGPSAGSAGPTPTTTGPPPPPPTTGPASTPTSAPDSAAGREGPVMLVSGDRGATWQVGACPEQDVRGRACEPPERAGDLLYRGDQVSVDGGRTWRAAAITPPTEPESLEPTLDGVVEDGAGGWLATASVEVPSDESHGYLLRSDDGLDWEQLLDPDPCRSQDVGRPNSSYEGPVRLGDQWLVAYSCLGLSTPVTAELFAASPGAGHEAEPVPIDGSRRDDTSYGQPVVLGDEVVVPERPEGASQIVALTVATH